MEPGSRKRRSPYPKENERPAKRKKMVDKFCLDLLNVPTIPPLNAFERGYQVESILDMVQNPYNDQYLYVKFKDLPNPELVSLDVVLEKAPELLADFYKEYVQAWDKLNQSRQNDH